MGRPNGLGGLHPARIHPEQVDWRRPACSPSGRVCGDGQAWACHLGGIQPFVLREHTVDHCRSRRLRCDEATAGLGRCLPAGRSTVRDLGTRVAGGQGFGVRAEARRPQAGRQSGGVGVSGPGGHRGGHADWGGLSRSSRSHQAAAPVCRLASRPRRGRRGPDRTPSRWHGSVRCRL